MFENDQDEQEDDPIALASAEAYEASGGAGITPHTEYQTKPVEWCRDKLGIPTHTLRWSEMPEYRGHTWDGTPDPLATALEALAAGKNVVMESATGVGKTYTFALATFWFDACWPDAIVRTHAPKRDQLTQHMWKEITRLFPNFARHFPKAHLGFLTIQMRQHSDVWGAMGIVAGVRAEEKETGSATKAQGAHAKHMLSIIEEGAGMPGPIVNAIRQTSKATHNLIFAGGNPDHQHDELHKLVGLDGWVHVIISALDSPNFVCRREVIPGATSYEGIIQAEKEHGKGSPFYDSRVRGISPKQSTEALIQYEWLEAAAERWEKRDVMAVEKMTGAKGVDVAQSKNGDKASIATMRGEYLVDLWSDRCPNATRLGETVVQQCREQGIEIKNVAVDGVGVGAATVNAIADVDPQVFNFVGGPIDGAQRGDDKNEWLADGNLFVTKRDQGWWTLREDIRLGRFHMKKHDELWRQLTMVKFKRERSGIRVESKEDIKKRTAGGASPDEADAVVYCNFVRPREARIVKTIVPLDPKRDEGAQETEWAQLNPTNPEYQYAAPDESGAFSQFSW